MTATTIERPVALPVDPGNLPTELRSCPQWVAWDWSPKPDKPGEWTKTPPCPTAPHRASSTDPSTWATFDLALARADRDGLAGIGLVFSTADPYTGIDLDKCRDPLTGELQPGARRIVDDLDSYAEVSASGTGVHIIVRGALPTGAQMRRRSGGIEMYDRGRYFVMTGHRLPGAPATVEGRQPHSTRCTPAPSLRPRPRTGGTTHRRPTLARPCAQMRR
jgi:primase-polymerase (primpol)-like protein